jgi:serine/threonine protein kinase
LLETEAYRLIYLKGEGVPRVFCYGNNKHHNILVIELLGRSLEELFNQCARKFTLKTVCVLGIEMLKRIQYVHEKNHIHRDIKPDNFMMGINENEDKLIIIDFGLAKKYRSSKKKDHIPFKSNKNITGTARYCSVNTHRGYEQSRRDDLESIGYVLMYFLRGALPWQGIKCKQDEDHYEKIYEKKKSTSTEELCKGFPRNLFKYSYYRTVHDIF